MRQETNERYMKQWSKFKFNFFDYLPTKYEANKREWSIRRMIWDFKENFFKILNSETSSSID